MSERIVTQPWNSLACLRRRFYVTTGREARGPTRPLSLSDSEPEQVAI